jgi:hypothetical protein
VRKYRQIDSERKYGGAESQLTTFIQQADVKKTDGRCSRTGNQLPAADRVVVVV